MNPNGNEQSNDIAVEAEAVQLPPEMPREPGSYMTGIPNSPERFARRERKQVLDDRRRLLVIAGGFSLALVIFVFALMSAHKPLPRVSHKNAANGSVQNKTGSEPSLAPVTDSERAPLDSADSGFATADDIAHTSSTSHNSSLASAPNAPGDTLASVPPFDNTGGWKPPAYQPTEATDAEEITNSRSEHEAMEKTSLVFVRAIGVGSEKSITSIEEEPTIRLPPGTRLRARLESVASTATQAPVVAVIEYNYRQSGEVILPAGAKVFGRVDQADRLGYVSVRFDSLMMPNGEMSKIEAVATDLAMRPLKGKVEGKNTGRNILVRSFSGVGQAAAMLAGRGSLNQPLSEDDLLRERVSNNIAGASDEQLAQMALTEHIVVTVPAGVSIYVVLQRPSKRLSGAEIHSISDHPSVGGMPTGDQLKQLLELQRELNDQSPKPPGT